MYSSTKSAFYAMSDALSMEYSRYLDKNIKVMLITPGSVRSNIANNAAGYELLSQLTVQAIYPNHSRAEKA